jgi:hypothetical protein
MKTLTLSLALFTAFAGGLFATSYAPPQERVVKSPNGLFLLRIQPNGGRHEIVAAKNPKQVIWSFDRNVWHDEYFVSDDGAHVAWIAWEFVRTDEYKNNAVEIWDKDGITPIPRIESRI